MLFEIICILFYMLQYLVTEKQFQASATETFIRQFWESWFWYQCMAQHTYNITYNFMTCINFPIHVIVFEHICYVKPCHYIFMFFFFYIRNADGDFIVPSDCRFTISWWWSIPFFWSCSILKSCPRDTSQDLHLDGFLIFWWFHCIWCCLGRES